MDRFTFPAAGVPVDVAFLPSEAVLMVVGSLMSLVFSRALTLEEIDEKIAAEKLAQQKAFLKPITPARRVCCR